MNRLKAILLIASGWLSTPLFSQGEVGNWLMYTGINRIADHWSIHTEAQYRLHTVLPDDIEQLLLRTGINYHLSPSAMVTTGYGYIASYDFDGDYRMADKIEHRIWQQLLMTNLLGRIKFEHRYRLEQRWVESIYSNRIRYRLMAFIPLNRPSMEAGTFFAGVYDEVFLNTRNNYFDRNRLYGALGYQISTATGIQAGILHQQVGLQGKWYLQLALTVNPDLRKQPPAN
jgi:hypothetical protein